MPIDPIKIPQNVYIEDRIVGPLTLKQIMIVGIGAGFSYAVYGTVTKTYGNIGIIPTAIIWFPTLIAAAFAFIKINDLSLMRICFLTIEQMVKAPKRVWEPRRGLTINIRTFATQTALEAREKEATKLAAASKNVRQLDAITSVLDRAMAPGQEEPDLQEYNPSSIRTMPETTGTPQRPGSMEGSPVESKFADIVPVNKDNIIADAVAATAPAVDGVAATRARSSIFRDITAK